MTIIEFFDKSPIENLISTLICRPERIVFLGKDRKEITRAIERYQRVMRGRGIAVEMLFCPLHGETVPEIVGSLEAILDGYDDCVLDLTGGSELHLAAVGVLMERQGERISCHRFNLRSGKLIDCDLHETVYTTVPFDLSAEETVLIHGGEIVTEEANPYGTVFTADWRFDDALCADVSALFSISREVGRLWNIYCDVLAAINPLIEGEGLRVAVAAASVEQRLRRRSLGTREFVAFMKRLEEVGVISSFFFGRELCFSYKNREMKRCLTFAGQILELKIAATLASLRGEDGEPIFHSTKVGLVIDWDGADRESPIRTLNEVDVMTMRDTVPIFISCKNGNLDVDELYKLSTVADRFGSALARRVLIAPDLDEMGAKGTAIAARAADMDIRIIDSTDSCSEAELARMLATL
jgi:hypothetical protein